MTDTRVLAYERLDDGRAGDLLAVGSLLLPWLATFHPTPSADNLLPNLDALAEFIGPAEPGSVRTRLWVCGAVREAVDATLFFGSGGEHEDLIVSAVLDRPSDLPCTPLPAPLDPPRDDPTQLTRLFSEHRLTLLDEDRALRRPGRARRPTTSRRSVAPAGRAIPWPPADDEFRWGPDKPSWWPPLVPFPPVELDFKVMRLHCPHFCIKWICTC